MQCPFQHIPLQYLLIPIGPCRDHLALMQTGLRILMDQFYFTPESESKCVV